MPPAALRFRHVVKRRSGGAAHARAVLDGVDLDIAPGEIVGLAGINGAGKTTLLRCLLDFCPLDGGDISIAGAAHTHPSARRPLAYLPERFGPPAHLTGAEFLRYVQALHGQRADPAASTALLALLDLDADALRLAPRHYSKGMTQKLGLAATLLLDKDILVLDEPTSGLDPKARAQFRQALRRRGDAGAAVLMTSHALADAADLCDRIAILHAGRIVFAGTPTACMAAFGGADLEAAFLAAIA
ncbi:ABC-2 type transport system ATP-binding protein [Pseudoduganella lurida]|uniref:ABC-2 type transport system ATP-binding protein n=1 Tax=Pseudoduganella lurida TaxID=1036180 RepID=A0A562RK70_9BURK|nr:ABC transporter ATP-binding protein [Pseudoduganella lurida]TWI69452.1 ABC-2 type transport system ATP-binding protein [Pseudoduganella lurida]